MEEVPEVNEANEYRKEVWNHEDFEKIKGEFSVDYEQTRDALLVNKAHSAIFRYSGKKDD